MAVQDKWRSPLGTMETTSSVSYISFGGIHMASIFECCVNCKPPKRHMGCHSQCEEYAKAKEVSTKRNAIINENKNKDFFYMNKRNSRKRKGQR